MKPITKNWRESKFGEPVLVATLLAVFFGLSLASSRHVSVTADEEQHYQYGAEILRLNSDRIGTNKDIVDDSKMPFTALNALPSKLTPFLPDGWLRRYSLTLQAGRPITLVFSVIIGFCLYKWAKRLYGFPAGVFSLFLYVLEPTILAHSHYVTTDIYAMGMMMLSMFALWHFDQNPTSFRLVVMSLVLGLSQLAKYSAAFLVPLFVIVQALHDAPEWWAWIRHKKLDLIIKYLGKWIGAGMIVGTITLATINAGYLFNRTLTPLGKYSFKSTLFQTIQAKLVWLSALPIPLPYPYLQGLDLVNFRDETGFGFGSIFLLGKLSPHGFPGYYFVDMIIKTPIPMLLAIGGGLIVLAWRKPSRGRILKNEIFLIVPIIWFLVYMNYFIHAQLGLRLILVIYPFMFILAANLVHGDTALPRTQLATISLLSSWLAISVLSYYPHFHAYSSELVVDKRKAYAYLAQGEFDWEQNKLYLQDWLSVHPAAVLDPSGPVSGTIVVTPKLLVGAGRHEDPSEFAWLRDNFQPVDIIAYTYPVFRVSPDDLSRISMDQPPH